MREVDTARLRALRVHDPDAIIRAAAARRRRSLTGEDGRLLLIAADHPARGALGVRGDGAAMADRADLLARMVLALSRPGVDGVLGTADVLEDLLLLGALEGKVVIGSMNRGGLQGATFEIDDRFTGYDARTIVEMGFDGGKMLCRIDLEDPATAPTLESCAGAVSALARAGVMAMLEPFMSRRRDGRVQNDLSPEAVIRSIAIAGGLGSTSRSTWLKIPIVPDMERVMAATTLPTLLLGGDPSGSPEEIYASWEHALAQSGVRGLVIGRSLLYPAGDDVAGAVDTAATLVHGTDRTKAPA